MSNIPDNATLYVKPSFLWLRTENGSVGSFLDNAQMSDERSFSASETAILECLKHTTSKEKILALPDVDRSTADAFLSSLQSWGTGVLDIQNGEAGLAKDDHERMIEAMRLHDIWAAMTTEEDENDRFHRTELGDAQQQFDEIETTVSHVFREPHAALSNRTYGEAFCDWLIETGRIRENSRVIEIGCGIGFFAKAILDRLAQKQPEVYNSISYTLFDLSPELQSAQRKTCSKHAAKVNFTLGNIETHQFGDDRFDLVLSNEVIADLSISAISADRVEAGKPASEAEELSIRYGLNCTAIAQGSKRMALLNTGPIKMLENLSHCMAKGGQAVITEYGTSGLSPKAVQFANHKEFSVHFGHLEHVATQLGFAVDLDTMGSAIGFARSSQTVEMDVLRTLNGFVLPYLERSPIPILAYTPETLRDVLGDTFDTIENLSFLPLDDPRSFSPFRFELLALSKE